MAPKDGYAVDIAALTKYSGELKGNKDAVSKVTDQVGEADVSDKSWGVVGLFVKQKYTDMLDDLKDLLKEMEDGLQSASDKIGTAAKAYKNKDDEHKQALSEIVKQLDDVVVRDLNA
ncbi:hypothetical protein FHX82_000855 [Amycolatopsis bartoniae]|uniref:ESX-1 secretion-associated protein n=1 Tax=Amycolatopsis bartoniae TaxID=941986 RepID=A0A8H9MG07_9PSEU|nr:type VII secretion target [Amycolatopsis bartoniae]MBB2933835.1 hypothetical protein [Amycolatopsis bartoniae]TVT10510.1 hypothetical protein FNH07_04545 [Amycolatopsis bartoniae]GHF87582.1 hypothetical protein GCM10017566_71760 [Amycolatopsis bartoniae]